MKTGRPIETKQSRYGYQIETQSPGPGGAHNWQPMSFNPGTGLMYIPAVEGSFGYVRERDFTRVPGFWNMGIDLSARSGSKDIPSLPESEYEAGTGTEVGAGSSLLAWDPVAAKPRWRVKYQGAAGGGTLTTAGNLVFQGLSDGRLLAYTAATGQKLWEVQLGNGIMAAPNTWELDGKQYVSVLVGWGGATGLYVPNPTQQYKAPGRLFTFVLDGNAKLAPVRGIEKNALTVVPYAATPRRSGSGLDAVRTALLHVPWRGGGERRGYRGPALCAAVDVRCARQHRAARRLPVARHAKVLLPHGIGRGRAQELPAPRAARS